MAETIAFRAAPAKAELRGEIPARQPRWLTDAVAVSIHQTRGLVKLVAAALGVADGRVYEVADINAPRPLPAWWIPSIVRSTKSFAILDALEAHVGRMAIPMPSLNPHLEEMHRELARTVQLFGQFLEENGAALEDGTIEKHEIGPLLRSLDAILAGVSAYRALVLEKFQVDQQGGGR